MGPDFLVPVAGMVTGLVLLLPLVRSGVRIMEKKVAGQSESEELLALRVEMRSIQERLDRAEFNDERIAELEERLDFTERMLAQQREIPKVAGDR